MARPKKKVLNDESPKTIEDNFLKEDFEGLGIPTEKNPVFVAKEIPKMETITFVNNRDPGITLYFHYHSKTHPLKHYTLVHGQKYTLPVEVIKHLEGEHDYDPWACHTRKYSRRMNAEGISETYASAYVPNFQLKQVRA
jgi:hypothetical protein